MDNKHARISISIQEGRFEIEGDEAFVEKHLDAFKDHVQKSLERMVSVAKHAPAAPGKPNLNPGGGTSEGLDAYPYLFAKSADGKIQILKPIPGGSTREKMGNAAMLTAFAHQLDGVSSVTFDAVRDTCTTHGCLDGGNFSKAIKDQKQNLIVAGKRGSNTASLSVPGLANAKTLAAGLNTA